MKWATRLWTHRITTASCTPRSCISSASTIKKWKSRRLVGRCAWSRKAARSGKSSSDAVGFVKPADTIHVHSFAELSCAGFQCAGHGFFLPEYLEVLGCFECRGEGRFSADGFSKGRPQRNDFLDS